MRHQYTPIFRDVITSRVWALSPAHRCVWLWFKLTADPEGFVCADTHGVSVGANVTVKEAKEAIAIFESAYVDDDGDPNEGRVLQKVPRGWRVLDFEEDRERSKHEAEKARKRRYMKRVRAAANDTGSETVDEPKPTPIPKPKPFSSEGEVPTVRSLVLTKLPEGWEPSDELRASAKIAGVTRLDERIKALRSGPIGGTRGVFASELDNYISSFFGSWKTWEETDRHKASMRPGAPEATPQPPPPPRIKGLPEWVREHHKTLCQLNGFDLKAEAKNFSNTHHIPPRNLRPVDAAEAFAHYLLGRANGNEAA